MEFMQSLTTTQSRETGRKEGIMASTFESQVREFAAEFPTANVQRMVALCEAGRIEWAQAYEISRKALAAGLGAVK
jgi:hypothetical protein